MSRKSLEALSIAAPQELDRRLPPPADLTPFEAQVWVAILSTKPSDWVQADSAPILVSYCKHISICASLDQKIESFNPDGGADDWLLYLKLIAARAIQTVRVESCATKLRMTPQSRYDASKAARKATPTKKLWE